MHFALALCDMTIRLLALGLVLNYLIRPALGQLLPPMENFSLQQHSISLSPIRRGEYNFSKATFCLNSKLTNEFML